MNNSINIAKLLKSKPKGTILYSPIMGRCSLVEVREGIYEDYDETVEVECFPSARRFYKFDYLGRWAENNNRLGECLLFPSKENRSWENYV